MNIFFEKYWKIGFVLMICIIIFLFNRNISLRSDINNNIQNIKALNTDLSTYRTKTGQLVAEKGNLVSSINDLKTLNSELYDSVKYYEKELKIKVSTIQNLLMGGKVEIVYDTVYRTVEKIDTNITRYYLSSEHSDSVVSSNINVLVDVFCDGIVELVNSEIDGVFVVDNLNLSIITGYRRQGLFRPSVEQITNVMTNDERFQINGISSWTKSEKAKPYIRVRPGLFVGGIYSPFSRGLEFGVGLGGTIQVSR